MGEYSSLFYAFLFVYYYSINCNRYQQLFYIYPITLYNDTVLIWRINHMLENKKNVLFDMDREFDSCLQFFTNQIAQNVDYINAFEFFYCQIR